MSADELRLWLIFYAVLLSPAVPMLLRIAYLSARIRRTKRRMRLMAWVRREAGRVEHSRWIEEQS